MPGRGGSRPLPFPKSFSLLGAGRMGTGLALCLTRAGLEPKRLFSRSKTGRDRARRLLVGGKTTSDPERAVEGDLIVLGLPDDALAGMATRLARIAEKKFWLHLSGFHGPEILAPLVTGGGRVLAIHPLQTVPRPALAPERLAGACFSVVAADADWSVAKRLVQAIGGKPERMSAAGRSLYHAAAVLACNDLVALLDLAFEMISHATEGRLAGEALLPLVQRTLEGVAALGTKEALTGPVVRGDLEVIRGHLGAIREGHPAALASYRALGLQTVEIARERGVSPARLKALQRILRTD